MPWNIADFDSPQRLIAARTCAHLQVLVDRLDRTALGDENALALAYAYTQVDQVAAELIEELLALAGDV